MKLPNRILLANTEKVDENEQIVDVHDPEVATVEEGVYEEITNPAEIDENMSNEDL